MSSMQENELHGWRLSDASDLRMGGYPAKVKSLVFLSKGMLMATAGAPGAVVWPFAGADGPMGKEAAEIGFEEGSTCHPCRRRARPHDPGRGVERRPRLGLRPHIETAGADQGGEGRADQRARHVRGRQTPRLGRRRRRRRRGWA